MTIGTALRAVRGPNVEPTRYFGHGHSQPFVPYTSLVTCPLPGWPLSDPVDRDASPIAVPDPESIRRRVLVVLGAAFALLMGIAAVEGFWPGAGPGQAGAIAFLLAAMVVVPFVLAGLARPLLRDIGRLAAENARLRELYGRAREDSLLDGLTGLGNHRAFQEELARQLDVAVRGGSAAVAPAHRRRRPQAVNDERGHAGGDELLKSVGRTVDRVAAAQRPRVPRRRRRVRDHPAGRRRRHRPDRRAPDPRRRPERRRPDAADRAVLAVDRRVRVPVAERRRAPAVPPRRRGPVLVQAPRPDERRGLRPGPPRPVAPTTARSRTCRTAIGTILAGRLLRPVYQPIFSLATGRPIGYEGLIRPGRGRAVLGRQHAVRGRGARRSDGRARHGLPAGRRRWRRRARCRHLPERQPLAAHARVRAVPHERAD